MKGDSVPLLHAAKAAWSLFPQLASLGRAPGARRITTVTFWI
jgi:hypothetical protein